MKKEMKDINDYTVLELLGEGTFGKVYKVQAPDQNYYALKLIKISPQIKQKTRQEGMILTSMKHPNILWAREFFYYQKEQYFVIVTEFCNGSLQDNIGNLTPELVQSIMIGIAQGIYYMHIEKNIIHRDLKPENILLNDLIPKIADLGLAKIIETDRATTKIGTPFYMALEMLQGDYDMEVDIWALGIIYIELILGQRIFHLLKGQQIPSKRSTFPSPLLLNKIQDQNLKNMIRSMLKKNPYERLKIQQVLRYLGVQKQNKGVKNSKFAKLKYREIVADCYQKTEQHFYNRFHSSFISQLYQKNLVEILNEAESANTKAFYLMGRIYQMGCGVKKDRTKSVQFYQKAFCEEQAHSCYELYRISESNSQKYQYLMRGKQKEEVRCIFALAENYLQGKEGRHIDLQDAEQYINYLCQKQYPPAFRLKGQLYGKRNTQFYNTEQRKKSLEIGQNLGDLNCKIKLAYQQFKQKQYAKVVSLCNKIQQIKDLQNQCLIQIIQLKAKSYKKMNYPRKACQEYVKGIKYDKNIERDFRGKMAEYFQSINSHKQAIKYYQDGILAIVEIHQKTHFHQQRLQILCDSLYAVYLDQQMYEDAFGVADLSSNLGHQSGKADKAYMIFSGTGVQRDENKGLSALQKLFAEGNKEAQSYLQDIRKSKINQN